LSASAGSRRAKGRIWVRDLFVARSCRSQDTQNERRAQIEDWIDDLVGFPLDKIEGACTEWRRSENRRPTPADIRKILTRNAPMPRTESCHQRFPPDPRTRDGIADARRAIAHRWDEVRQAIARGMAAASIQAGIGLRTQTVTIAFFGIRAADRARVRLLTRLAAL
jgi:hypothetical protein